MMASLKYRHRLLPQHAITPARISRMPERYHYYEYLVAATSDFAWHYLLLSLPAYSSASI